MPRRLLAGIRAVRRLVQMPSLKDLVVRETRPGPEVQTEQQILDYIRLTTPDDVARRRQLQDG